MAAVLENQVTKESIGDKRERYLAHSENLMVVVIDFEDGPCDQPDEPHSHPHEQITYVARGELLFFLDGVETRLAEGDVFVIPPDVPHSIQPISNHVRLVDSFSPIRDDFLSD